MSCHGEKGNGQGEFAEWITTKPRDYRQGTFKWRSTPSGSLPTDADLERVLINGLYGTYMPSWDALGHRQRLDVIAYIKTFSPRFATEKPQPPIIIPPEPALHGRIRCPRRSRLQEIQLRAVSRRLSTGGRSFGT